MVTFRYVYHLQGNAKYMAVAAIFGAVAVLFFMLPHWIFDPFESQKNWVQTIGKMNHFSYNQVERKQEQWYSYITSTGDTIVSKSNTTTSNPDSVGTHVALMYNPNSPSDFFINDKLRYKTVIRGCYFGGSIFGTISFFLVIMLLVKVYYQIHKPHYLVLIDWWIEIIGGSIGALAFAIPATFIDVFVWMLTGEWSVLQFTDWIMWVFRLLGLGVSVGLFFMVKYFHKTRPRV
jgi:hypothetical protein